jgi:ferrous iron transport protein B
MTIMTTTLIPCGAKVPYIAMVAGASSAAAPGWQPPPTSWVWPPIIVSGLILKKTLIFAGEPPPFVMDLPAYHGPRWANVLRSMWGAGLEHHQEGRYHHPALHHRVLVPELLRLGEDGFRMLERKGVSMSSWPAWAASSPGSSRPGLGQLARPPWPPHRLVAKENIVGTMGIHYRTDDASVCRTWAMLQCVLPAIPT